MSVPSRTFSHDVTLNGEEALKGVKYCNGLDITDIARLTNKTVGHVIKKRRKQSEITIEEFARSADKTYLVMRRIEAGSRPLAISDFKDIAKALDIDHLELAQEVFDQVDAAVGSIKPLK